MPLPEDLATEISDAVDAIAVDGDNVDGDNVDDAVDVVVDDAPAAVADADAVVDDAVDVVVDADADADAAAVAAAVDGEPGTDLIVPPAISDNALSQAVLAGISISDARNFPSDEALLHIVDAIVDAKRVEVEVDAGADDPLDNLPTLDPETYGEAAVEMFDKLTAVVRSQRDTINEFRSEQQDIEKANSDANVREVTGWFDKQINDLGDDFTEALGTGSINNLDQGSSQLAKRDQIAGQLAVLRAGYNDTGMPLPSRDELFNSATRIVLHDEFAKIDAKKLSDKLAKRSSQHIQRAGGRMKKDSPTSTADIAKELDERFFKSERQ